MSGHYLATNHLVGRVGVVLTWTTLRKQHIKKGFTRTWLGSGSVAFPRGSLGSLNAFDDGDERIGRDRGPDLRLHGLLGRAVELLDPNIPLDPLEGDLDLPAAAVQLGDRHSWQD